MASLRPFSKTAIEVLSGAVGAGVAGSLGVATGDPILSAASAEFIAHTFNDVVTRTLSTREAARVGTVGLATASALTRLRAKGSRLRDDGFFDERLDGRSSGDEVVEHVLLAAKSSFEERKLPLYGQLLASVACYDNICGTTANWAITTFEALSYTQVLLLAAYYRRDEFELPPLELYSNPPEFEPWSIHKALHELSTEQTGLIHTPMERGDLGQPVFPTTHDKKKLTTAGTLLADLCQLRSIPKPEVEGVLDLLRRTRDLVAGQDGFAGASGGDDLAGV